MANTYYSGQGSVYASPRDVNGKPTGFVAVGNVPELEISIEVTKYEHKESESGTRAVDLAIVQEKKGTFRMLVENASLDNLAMGFWGSTATVAAGTFEVQVLAPTDISKGDKIAIGAVNVSGVVVGDDTVPTNAYQVWNGTTGDYTLDAKYGTITIMPGGAITAGQNLFIDYTTAVDELSVEAFTANSLERYIRFEGLNTIDGEKDVLVELYKVQLDPISGYQLINEEIAQLEITGSLLYDSKQTGTSKYFKQTVV